MSLFSSPYQLRRLAKGSCLERYREMIKLRSRRLFKSKSKLSCGGGGGGGCGRGDIGWELRPGGMLVQKRASGGEEDEEVIQLRITTGSWWHDISILATSTFGELKLVLSLVTGLEPREQRLLFRGKEREDGDRLHMVGVQDRDKVLLLEDPAIREIKKASLHGNGASHKKPLSHLRNSVGFAPLLELTN